MATTDIYRIKTRNSIYEIHVHNQEGTFNRPSECRKEGESVWRRVSDFSGDYLEKLCIGPGFFIPGVVDTSNVQDYLHFVLSPEPKRKAKKDTETTIPKFFAMLAEEVGQQVRGGAVLVEEEEPSWMRDPGCSEDCRGKDSPARHNGARLCKSGSIASGGTRSHCTCDYCY